MKIVSEETKVKAKEIFKELELDNKLEDLFNKCENDYYLFIEIVRLIEVNAYKYEAKHKYKLNKELTILENGDVIYE